MLHEVLDEFAQGLSAKERRAVSSRVGEALDRRRDARDAGKFRRGEGEKPAIEIPAVSPEIAELVEPAVGSEPARNADDVPAAKPAPKSAVGALRAAKSAAEKTTPAPTTNAPEVAKKTAAARKTAPAKQAAAAKKAAAKAPAKKAAAGSAAAAKATAKKAAPAKSAAKRTAGSSTRTR
jgi:hypothetical protein